MGEDNAKTLRDAGLIADSPLPDRYYEMIVQLTGEEIQALLSLKQRLDEAGIPTAPLSTPRAGGEQAIVIL